MVKAMIEGMSESRASSITSRTASRSQSHRTGRPQLHSETVSIQIILAELLASQAARPEAPTMKPPQISRCTRTAWKAVQAWCFLRFCVPVGAEQRHLREPRSGVVFGITPGVAVEPTCGSGVAPLPPGPAS